MKKLITVMAILFLSSVVAFAQDTSSDKNANGMMDKGSMMGKSGMMDGGMMMHGMMMKMGGMMNNFMVATPDGGVIVLSGGELTKYDKDLNVIKEVQVKSNMQDMQKMMSDMMEKCPMMGQGMMGGSDVDHASHHQE